MSPTPVTRSRLCELLWDIPDDPRGELRWCLSRLRRALGARDGACIEAQGDTLTLDRSHIFIDAVAVEDALRSGFATLDLDALHRLEALFHGPFADGLELDRSPEFASWVDAQRRRFRAAHIELIEQLVARSDGAQERLLCIEKWLQQSPFDVRAHDALLTALLHNGRIEEAEHHLAAAIRAFETEGLNWLPIREGWRAKRNATLHEQIIVPMSGPDRAPRIETHIESIATETPATKARRASICVMPFVHRTSDSAIRGGVADGLTDDIITRLAKLRSLFVIARGSVYALAERQVAAAEAGKLLNVDYVASGTLQIDHGRLHVSVELSDAHRGCIVWAEDFKCKPDDLLQAIDQIGNRIVASLAEEIEGAERKRALLKSPNSLDSWEAYHRGLWHMYRFSERDNALAAHFFECSVRQDPTFARAYAGLSFTHFQNAFLLRPENRQKEIDLAYDAAGHSLLADDRDPAAHWAMGRALWLRGRQDDALLELQQCVNLSPNFALGHYTLGFVQCQSGDPRLAITATDFSRNLSPFDPLTFAMLASRALAHLRLGDYREAAEWGLKGAMRPNAHTHVLAIAANCLAAADRIDEARAYVAMIHKRSPGYRIGDFINAFRFDEDALALFRKHASLIGLG